MRGMGTSDHTYLYIDIYNIYAWSINRHHSCNIYIHAG